MGDTIHKYVRSVVVTETFQALHRWLGCDICEVGFLKYPHRHVFKCQAEVQVQHNDRDVEFFILKRDLGTAILTVQEVFKSTEDGFFVLDASCEMMCEQLISSLQGYGYNVVSVEVWEDGENGARIRRGNL